jgi:flavodoxin
MFNLLKAIIIYYTQTGNTKSLAEKIKKRLESLSIAADIYQDTNFKDIDSIKDFDIICLGSPTHYFQIAKNFKELLQKISDINLGGKKLIVFGTGSSKSGPPKICKDIANIMKPTGIQTIAKIGCIKKPTEEIDSKLEQILSQDIF